MRSKWANWNKIAENVPKIHHKIQGFAPEPIWMNMHLVGDSVWLRFQPSLDTYHREFSIFGLRLTS